MATSKSKDGYGKVNAENISGKAVPRKGGRSDQRKMSPNYGMNAPQAFSKATYGKPNLPQTGNGLQGALSGRPTGPGRGGRGPTLKQGM